MMSDRHDATAYGRSFADVYDDWYPPDSQSEAAAAEIEALAGTSAARGVTARVLELGVGSGRLAIPLVERGLIVVGIDASDAMLSQLAQKSSDRVAALVGDVSDPAAWPEGPFDVVVAAFNLICNLLDVERQRRLFELAAGVLDAEGTFVVEVNEPVDEPQSARLDVRHVTDESVVLMATQFDAGSGIVVGQHIELRDGVAPKLRPWKVRLTTLDELDGWAASAGLRLVGRTAGWDDDGASVVSRYRRAL